VIFGVRVMHRLAPAAIRLAKLAKFTAVHALPGKIQLLAGTSIIARIFSLLYKTYSEELANLTELNAVKDTN